MSQKAHSPVPKTTVKNSAILNKLRSEDVTPKKDVGREGVITFKPPAAS
jgi:hypothetical protein